MSLLPAALFSLLVASDSAAVPAPWRGGDEVLPSSFNRSEGEPSSSVTQPYPVLTIIPLPWQDNEPLPRPFNQDEEPAPVYVPPLVPTVLPPNWFFDQQELPSSFNQDEGVPPRDLLRPWETVLPTTWGGGDQELPSTPATLGIYDDSWVNLFPIIITGWEPSPSWWRIGTLPPPSTEELATPFGLAEEHWCVFSWPEPRITVSLLSGPSDELPAAPVAPVVEDIWIQPLVSEIGSVGVAFRDDEVLPTPLPDESDYWINRVTPIPLPWAVAVVLTDDEALPRHTPDDADYWINPVIADPLTVLYHQWISDEQLIGPSNLPIQEDYWINWTPPVPVATEFAELWSAELNEIPAYYYRAALFDFKTGAYRTSPTLRRAYPAAPSKTTDYPKSPNKTGSI